MSFVKIKLEWGKQTLQDNFKKKTEENYQWKYEGLNFHESEIIVFYSDGNFIFFWNSQAFVLENFFNQQKITKNCKIFE